MKTNRRTNAWPQLSETQQLLCDVVQCHDWQRSARGARRLVDLLGDEDAFAFCERNRVASIAGHYLGQRGLAPRWAGVHDETSARIKSYLQELDAVAERLAAHGIDLVALKNAGIARGLYPCPGCCPMGDLDVLVRRGNFCRAHQVLLDMGYQLAFRSRLEAGDFVTAERSGSAEYHKRLSHGEPLWLELQWRPIAGRWIRPDQEPLAEELLERASPIDGSRVMLLSPVDNLLQVALHTAKHSYVRAPGFRLHTDVDRIVRYQCIDWDVFSGEICRMRTRTATYFSLRLAAELLGTPIPREVLSAIRPAAWKEGVLQRWLAKVGLFDPGERKFGQLAYPLFTALLYDEVAGLARGVFPRADWMREHYGSKNRFDLPLLHLRRLLDLTLRRENI